jgi:hypothetical protein
MIERLTKTVFTKIELPMRQVSPVYFAINVSPGCTVRTFGIGLLSDLVQKVDQLLPIDVAPKSLNRVT